MLMVKDKDGKILPLKSTKWYKDYNYKMVDSNNIVTIACGKCEECLQNKMLELKKRIENELKINPKAYFLTLTYDDEHKKNLNKRDIQLFLKRLRKKTKLRYFYRGELGEKTERPHYHMILWTEKPKDLEECENKTKSGYKQYKSKEIEKTWSNGLVRISDMTKELVNYIIKYTLKNLKKEEIIGWSRKPPLGVDPNKIEQKIQSINRTKTEKKYWKYRNKEIPILDAEVERAGIRLKKIEEQKIKYFDYLEKRRRK